MSIGRHPTAAAPTCVRTRRTERDLGCRERGGRDSADQALAHGAGGQQQRDHAGDDDESERARSPADDPPRRRVPSCACGSVSWPCRVPGSWGMWLFPPVERPGPRVTMARPGHPAWSGRAGPVGTQVRGGAAGDQRQVEVGLDAGLGGARRTGSRSRSAWPSTTMPGLRTRPASIVSGCRPWKVELDRRVAGDLDLEPLALGAELPRRVEVLLAHQPVHARR